MKFCIRIPSINTNLHAWFHDDPNIINTKKYPKNTLKRLKLFFVLSGQGNRRQRLGDLARGSGREKRKFDPRAASSFSVDQQIQNTIITTTTTTTTSSVTIIHPNIPNSRKIPEKYPKNTSTFFPLSGLRQRPCDLQLCANLKGDKSRFL